MAVHTLTLDDWVPPSRSVLQQLAPDQAAALVAAAGDAVGTALMAAPLGDAPGRYRASMTVFGWPRGGGPPPADLWQGMAEALVAAKVIRQRADLVAGKCSVERGPDWGVILQLVDL